MAVVLRKTVEIDGRQLELRVYEPKGVLSREDRLRADELDEVLQQRVPQIAANVIAATPKVSQYLRRWYVIGKELRELLGNAALVSSEDIDTGRLWVAVWQYLPTEMSRRRSISSQTYAEQQHRRRDDLSLAYELSAFDWQEVAWIQRWKDGSVTYLL